MTKKVASLPSWVVFGMLIIPYVIGSSLPYGTIIVGASYFIWIYSLGVEAHKALPASMEMPIIKFKLALFYFLVYVSISSVFFSTIMPYAIPFHVFAMICIFYSFCYVAKAIRTVELNRIAKFEDWFAAFFGMWFFPIGVWFIQRKIRRIVALNV
jgi:hypothetical protein